MQNNNQIKLFFIVAKTQLEVEKHGRDWTVN